MNLQEKQHQLDTSEESNISTLVEDIYRVIGTENHPFDALRTGAFGERLATHIANRISEEAPKEPALRLSGIGTPCDRKLWYKINKPDVGEPLRNEVRFKFLFGDILEELLLFLASEAGHKVDGTQSELEISGVKGHRDAIIDGMLVDVKSASTYSFKKFQEGLTPENDSFGYLDQLQSYLFASQDDPALKIKDKAAFLVVDKTLGHICLDIHPINMVNYNRVVDNKRAIVQGDLPPRGFDDVPEGASGNRKLDTVCSYCEFRRTCWPSTRTFFYSRGPVHLTVVKREPNVPEEGKF